MEVGQRLEPIEKSLQFKAALKVVTTLRELGYQTVFAGGCVRDSLLGKAPKDIDLATKAPSEVVEKTFKKTLSIGKAFGTIVVVEEGFNFEVTTFRKDGQYLDGRYPIHVEFSDIREDALRRDFTINALFYDPVEFKILDFVGGIQDINAKILRTVGLAAERFAEDRLRMLRAVRFVGQLGFKLDPSALAAIQKDFFEMKLVSVERVVSELKKILEGEYFWDGFNVFLKSRLYEQFWPELVGFKSNRLQVFGKFLSWKNAFSAICVLSEIRDPEPRLRSWKVSRDEIKAIQSQLKAIEIFRASTLKHERVKVLGGDEYAEILVLLNGLFGSRVNEWVLEYLSVADRNGKLPEPLLKGDDLLSHGFAKGAQLGQVLKEVYDCQLNGKIKNKKQALAYLKSKV